MALESGPNRNTQISKFYNKNDKRLIVASLSIIIKCFKILDQFLSTQAVWMERAKFVRVE
jgi:hypothetical protein